jgi:hypothetical protein
MQQPRILQPARHRSRSMRSLKPISRTSIGRLAAGWLLRGTAAPPAMRAATDSRRQADGAVMPSLTAITLFTTLVILLPAVPAMKFTLRTQHMSQVGRQEWIANNTVWLCLPPQPPRTHPPSSVHAAVAVGKLPSHREHARLLLCTLQWL